MIGAQYGDLGMIFLKAETLEAATVWLDADPGVRSSLFAYRIAPLRVFLSVAAVSDAIANARGDERDLVTLAARVCEWGEQLGLRRSESPMWTLKTPPSVARLACRG